ncbi:hypothetical protein PAXRUDRAFT_828351 [Paxillus rubicundulus Ve08.2h10]|uniref:Uncharacterized protein n=1 Tax=Paxillus rubicundulus Ve08.2h10 TaxID=930991 RepID=A0A0D0DAE5_9AGAM|nr:hypothetical protein PAXRUDRAFT_828351 [Paxillus rubicundulus Ve08.2h10]
MAVVQATLDSDYEEQTDRWAYGRVTHEPYQQVPMHEKLLPATASTSDGSPSLQGQRTTGDRHD